MIERTAKTTLLERLGYYPIVSVTGPRQSGKSTLIKNALPDYRYVTLEDKDNLAFATADPRGFLAAYPAKTIIDEAQLAPDLFSYLQTQVDADEESGQYVLSGSQNFLLSEKISQSLAGRVGVVRLLPLSYPELAAAGKTCGTPEFILKGGYPRLHVKNIPPAIFYADYLETYIERDVRRLANIGDHARFKTFIRICASRIGSCLNIEDLASTAGIHPRTARSWLSVLQAGYIVHLVQPYYRNFEKRLSKTPKLYFHDTGLACHLQGTDSAETLLTGIAAGHLFENLVYNEFIKHEYNSGRVADNFYYWRENETNEVDLLAERGGSLSGFEIKSSKTRQPGHFKGLNRFAQLAGIGQDALRVIYDGETVAKHVNWRDIFNGTSSPVFTNPVEPRLHNP